MDIALILTFSTPVLFAAYGEAIVQRSGVLNIGLEGTMLVGAFFAFLVAIQSGNPWLGIIIGTLAGCLLTLVFAVFAVRMRLDQVVVGTAITLLALGLTGTLYRIRFGSAGQLLTVQGFPKWAGLDVFTVLAVLIAFALQWSLFRTSWGLKVRATGESPQAVHAAHLDPLRVRIVALAIGGALGGLGGAYLSIGVAQSFAENMTNGRGFVAIAMVTFARWQPWLVLPACLFIGFLDALQFVGQSKNWNVPYALLLALPYACALIALAFVSQGSRSPAQLGVPLEERH